MGLDHSEEIKDQPDRREEEGKEGSFFGDDANVEFTGAHWRSPRMRRASWMSLGMMVTRFAWMAQRFVSSKRPTR